MPPKPKGRGKSAKKVPTKGGKTGKASNGGRELRPKKGTNYKELNSGKGSEKTKDDDQGKSEKDLSISSDAVSLTPGSSDDDLDRDCGDGSNTTNSATPDDNQAEAVESRPGVSTDRVRAVDLDRSDLLKDDSVNQQVKKLVGQCLKRYRKKHAKRRGKKKRKRHHYSSSDDSSESEGSTTSSDEYSSESSDYSSSSRDGKKRKRSHHKRSSRKTKKSKSTVNTLVESQPHCDSPSQSTIYTRGCKSPPQTGCQDSSDTVSPSSGGIPLEANSDEFLSSVNTSLNKSTPIPGRQRSNERRSASEGEAGPVTQGREDDAENRERDQVEAETRERADRIVRDIQLNKSSLAKPSGEWERELYTLLIDLKHVHLTSHVDRKLKDRILEGDFTVDFRRLVPHSRSRCKTDDRLNVVNKDGMTHFVPADRENVKDINSYKQWEIAFKVFMGVYISKWPERSKELLEYSHTIQNASLTYPWENVFNYDIAIREIMTDHPGRLWGQICQRTWAIELGEPTSKVTYVPSGSATTSSGQRLQKKVCWRFNKGRCTFGANCEFDHRCSVCGGRSHGRHNCYKRGKGNDRPAKEIKREKSDK